MVPTPVSMLHHLQTKGGSLVIRKVCLPDAYSQMESMRITEQSDKVGTSVRV